LVCVGVFGMLGLRAIAGPTSASAQGLAPAEFYREVERAYGLLGERRYPEAAESLARLVAADSQNQYLASGFAFALEQSGRCDEAIPVLERLLVLGYRTRPRVATRIAACHTRAGRRDLAFAWLDSAVALGLESRVTIATDTNFAGLRDDPRYARITGRRPADNRTRDDRWRLDLEFLAAEARRIHASWKRPAFSPAFDSAIARLRERIPQLSDDRIGIELRRILTLLGDGHSNIGLRLSALPVNLYQFSDGLFVIGGSAAGAPLVGSKVLRLGTLTAEEALQRVAPFVPRDNAMGLLVHGPRYLIHPVVLEAIGAVSDTVAVPLVLLAPSGDTLRPRLSPAGVRVAPYPLRPPPMLAVDRRPLFFRDTTAYWMTVLPGGRTVYVQFNQVASLGSDPLPQFAERLKRTLADSGTTSLVVDIRNNGGGNTELYPPLVGAVIHFVEGAPDARVFVIIGRHTFSAAQNFASTLQRYVRDVVFVGEPSGSRPNFVGESQPLLLPFSELRASVSSRYHQNADFTDSRQWIAPDVPASLSSADYFSGRDPALDAILELTGGRT